MTRYKYVDGVTSEMTAEEETAFDDSLPADPPRTLPRKLFFEELAKDGNYGAFKTWLAGQDEETQVYFDEEPGFPEGGAKVAAAMTALALATEDFYDAALTRHLPTS